MSRSKRKTPITGITTAESEKRDKRIADKNLRRVAKTIIQQEDSDELTLLILREVSNELVQMHQSEIENPKSSIIKVRSSQENEFYTTNESEDPSPAFGELRV